MDNTSTKQKIINTTFDIISKNGVSGITIRKIAALAEVNIALINYHFKNKETLINETMKVFINKVQGIFDRQYESGNTVKLRLTKTLYDFAKNANKHPGFVKATAHKLMTNTLKEDDPFNDFIINMQVKVNEFLKSNLQGLPQDKLNHIKMIISSAIIYPIIIGDYSQIIYSVNLKDDLHLYIDTIIEQIIQLHKETNL